MSLLTECHRWSALALRALGEESRGAAVEMHLQAALGVATMFTRGGSDAARTALTRSFAIAEKCGGALDQLQVLGPLQMFYIRTGDFNTSLRFARQCPSSPARSPATPAPSRWRTRCSESRSTSAAS